MLAATGLTARTVSGALRMADSVIAQSRAFLELSERSTPTTMPGISSLFSSWSSTGVFSSTLRLGPRERRVQGSTSRVPGTNYPIAWDLGNHLKTYHFLT